ncbi:hypothetical protein PR048_012207 [Dryococelus australis]|uniref:Uncharacterized protein n=1 Tax=Dryococelus australis TaxID=614101 RepID=A0ABQ9HNW7_9NEOP|nr:hypothetical protein PR048_012207 [Dryococelus australis]
MSFRLQYLPAHSTATALPCMFKGHQHRIAWVFRHVGEGVCSCCVLKYVDTNGAVCVHLVMNGPPQASVSSQTGAQQNTSLGQTAPILFEFHSQYLKVWASAWSDSSVTLTWIKTLL